MKPHNTESALVNTICEALENHTGKTSEPFIAINDVPFKVSEAIQANEFALRKLLQDGEVEIVRKKQNRHK